MKKQLPINFSPIQKVFQSIMRGNLGSVFDRLQSSKKLGIYFTTILIGLSASRLGSSVISYMLSSEMHSIVPASTLKAPQRRVSNTSLTFDLSSIIDGVFFKRLPPSMAAAPEMTNAPEVKNFSLIGTLEGDPSFARAVIRILGSKEEPTEYAIGEKIGEAVLISIGYEKIWVRINGTKYKIEIGESSQDIQNKSAQNQNEAIAGAEVSKVISRQEINEKILGNPAAIYGGGASFGPYLVNGKIEGFRLHRIPSNHIFYSLGARSGDIIKSVNGYALTNTSQMMELWNNIKTMPKVNVELIRNGNPMTFNFEIRN